MILMIDNFDSFTYNIVQMVSVLGEEVLVRRNNELSAPEVDRLSPDGIIISPGPGAPQGAGISVELIERFCERIPILGVCLGHQCLAAAFGARIRHARAVMHGKLSRITHSGGGLFRALPPSFSVVRYHSLAGEGATLPDDLRVCARAEDGEVMAVEHTCYPLFGLQFHPESIATEYGTDIIDRFISVTKEGQ